MTPYAAIVDSVRYARLVAAVPAQRSAREASLVTKLTRARRVWGIPAPVDPAQVSSALRTAGDVNR